MSAINSSGLPTNGAVPAGQLLLLASFGAQLLLLHRRSEPLTTAFERFAVGVLGICFFSSALSELRGLSDSLGAWVQHLGNTDGLLQILGDAYSDSVNAPGTTGPNIVEVIRQVWRTGVWAVAKSISEFFFIASGFMLIQAQKIFWNVLSFLFPLFIGFFPVAPWLLMSASLFAIELSLWVPVLYLIQIASFPVAREAHAILGSLGVPLIATEIVSICLYLSVPVFTHRLITGALHGDHGVSLNVFSITKRVTGAVQ